MKTWLPMLLLPTVSAAELPAYRLYDRTGAAVVYDDLLPLARTADVILFGELHDDPIGHWLQRRLLADLFAARGEALRLGLEMLEREAQLPLDEFLADTIRAKDLTAAVSVWPNHDGDYQPLLDFCKAHRIPVVASNVPRRYAALVARSGLAALDDLSPAARALLPPLPMAVDLSLPGYQGIVKMAGPGAQHGGMSGENMALAQALKDATMARSIVGAWSPGLGAPQRTYHSNRKGRCTLLRSARPRADHTPRRGRALTCHPRPAGSHYVCHADPRAHALGRPTDRQPGPARPRIAADNWHANVSTSGALNLALSPLSSSPRALWLDPPRPPRPRRR